MSRKFRFIAFTANLLFAASLAAFPGSRYFPETGRGAIHQRTLDLQGNAVVMYVAMEPGQEDLPFLSFLRLGQGARTVVVYVTNGDATPSDMNGDSPQYTAARRKEEAFAATALIGAQSFFLNLPDPGVVDSSRVLEAIWGRDTVVARVGRAIRSYRPDLLILGGDPRGTTLASVRQRLIARLTLESAEGKGPLEGGAGTPPPWKVPRIVVEDPGGRWKAGPMTDGVHPVWKKSYRAIGAEAGRHYGTLRMAEGVWDGGRNRSYGEARSTVPARGGSITSGLPQVGKRLAALPALIRRAAGKGRPTLEEVSAVIDSVESVIARRGNELDPGELRLIAAWKNTLEDLRCSLLGVSVELEPTDSLVTQTQLVNLKIKAVRSNVSPGRLKIFFPTARDRRWGINESAEYKFDLAPPAEFRVLTPHDLDFNMPVSQFGMLRSVPRTRFPFLIYHEDSIRARNFVYRGELSLLVGPKRTFEVLTPAIRAQQDEPVVYRLINISRDKYRGTIGFADSLALPGERPAVLEARGETIVDTLFYTPSREALPPVFAVKVQLSGEGTSTRVLARRFDAAVDSSLRLGLLTPFADGVVERALRRLRVPQTLLSPSDGPPRGLEGLNTIVVDRGAMAQWKGMDGWALALDRWVEGGGHLVVLPQRTLPSDLPFLRGLRFGSSDPTEPGERVAWSGDHPFFRTPNPIPEEGWRDWVVSRSLCRIEPGGGRGVESILRSAKTDAPYLVTVRSGRGRLTLVALDLVSQLTNVHPGAHRLLANLISPVH